MTNKDTATKALEAIAKIVKKSTSVGMPDLEEIGKIASAELNKHPKTPKPSTNKAGVIEAELVNLGFQIVEVVNDKSVLDLAHSIKTELSDTEHTDYNVQGITHVNCHHNATTGMLVFAVYRYTTKLAALVFVHASCLARFVAKEHPISNTGTITMGCNLKPDNTPNLDSMLRPSMFVGRVNGSWMVEGKHASSVEHAVRAHCLLVRDLLAKELKASMAEVKEQQRQNKEMQAVIDSIPKP